MTANLPEPGPLFPGDLAYRQPGASAWAQVRQIRATVPATPESPDPAWSWALGAEGEEQAAALFADLGEGWHVLHDITVSHGGANIDHVLVGPPGVFVVNTKNHRGGTVAITADLVTVNGAPTDYLDKAVYERDTVAERLGRMLPILPQPIVSVLLVLNARELLALELGTPAAVLNEHAVVEALRSLPPVYTPEQTRAMFDQMRDPATWLPARVEDPVTVLLRLLFAMLGRGVQSVGGGGVVARGCAVAAVVLLGMFAVMVALVAKAIGFF